MLTTNQKQDLLKLVPNIKFNEPLSQHTYFCIGGPADAFLPHINSDHYDERLRLILKFCANEKIEVTVLGQGSNVLISDNGLRGLVLRLDSRSMMSIPSCEKSELETIQVASGCLTQGLVKLSLSLGLTGLEPFLGLPGTVGGAVYGNAHFKMDQLFGNFVTRVWTISFSPNNSMRENCYKQNELKFSYGHSLFQSLPNKETIILVEVALKKGEKKEIESLAKKLLEERKNSQPFDLPSSGCAFKNPGELTFAAELIDGAGLKGMRIGGAKVSTKHANFIVNPHKTATAQDVLNLIIKIQDVVLEKYGIFLEPEISILGMGKAKKG